MVPATDRADDECMTTATGPSQNPDHASDRHGVAPTASRTSSHSGSHTGSHTGNHSDPSPQTTLNRVWSTRPLRAVDDHPVAGVCAGIGRRYDVDPLLVRIAFVVAALWGGAGVFLYSLAWLVLPKADDEVSLGESLLGRGAASGSKTMTVGLLLLALVSSPTIGGSADTLFLGAGILMTVLMLAGLVGLDRRTPVPPPGTSAATPPPTVLAAQAAQANHSTPTTDTAPAAPTSPYPATHPAPTGPPSWDPLGAAPFAWNLPEPGEPPVQAPVRPRSRLVGATLGAALLTATGAVALHQFGGIEWLTPARIGALGLAVVSAGLVVGAITRRGLGLLVVAGPLAGFVLLAALVDTGFDTGDGHTADSTRGDLQVSMSSDDQLRGIHQKLGDVRVDLTHLELRADHTLPVSSDLGDVTVRVPRGLDVDVRCTTGLGSTDCPSGLDVGDDGRGGPVLTVDAHSRLGDVEVTR